ncbi:putative pyrroloquinoline-quinone binding quinoprotein [Actinokineospora cianjurensis]|uniref:Putative pyrroloquinoline-quinone binding quinoprotein n=2 Tax=Actinokineospora cianjurensis TaxID=585224 RepID=A0A421AX89_9PSEU|nr:putative pyrroloquinoline-quinone binding quinoprotein [Actinokineospora cianjurensis]
MWAAEVGPGRDIRVKGGLVLIEGAPVPDVVLDPADGRQLWRSPGTTTKQVRLFDDVVLISYDSETVMLERKTGAELWRTPEVVTVQEGTLVQEGSGRTWSVPDPRTGVAKWATARDEFSNATVAAKLVLITQDQDGPGDTVTAYDLVTGAQG